MVISDLQSLEEITDLYNIVLIDTCALLLPLHRNDPNNLNEEIVFSKERYDSAILFKEQVEQKKNCYITLPISEEYNPKKCSFKKVMRKKSIQNNRKKLELCRIKTREHKERRRLVDILERDDKVLNLIESDLYSSLYEEYLWLENKFKLGEIDFDLLISGITLFQTNNSSVLISNDFPLMYAWKDFMKIKKLDFDDFGFYLRKQFDGFERAYLIS